MPKEKIHVVGQPIAARYCLPAGDKNVLREKLGWEKNKKIVLMVGGGDGMGPLEKTARAVADSGLDVSLVIVTGRNIKLKEKLEAQRWQIPVHIYGFTKDMPDFMRAADVLITKAGPGTIAEALNAHLPIILYARLPGQEDGNVTFVQMTNSGVWAPSPAKVVATLKHWLENPAEMKKVVDACRSAARPDSSRAIARVIASQIGISKN